MSDTDLYSEFDTLASSPVIRTIIGSNRSSGPNSPGEAFGTLMPPGGSMGPTLRPPTMAMFNMGGDMPLARPMTSVAGAGFSSAINRPKLFDPLMQAANIASLAAKPEATPQQQAQTMEKNVHALLEESINAGLEGQYTRALERAKECAKKERLLNKFREKHQLPEQNNVDLTFAVCMNLGQQYHANGMLQDALNTYAMIVKNKGYQPGSRLRVNMGNIYYQQKKYPSAIKMYRMAMDQIGQTNKDMRSNIMRNIGDCFVKLGQFSAAIDTYEAVIDAQPDPQSAFNLVICYYALGDKEKMKKGFIQLLSSRFDNGRRDGKDIDDEADEHDIDIEAELLEHDEKLADDPNRKLLSPLREKTTDELAKYLRGKKKSLARYVLTAAQLIAPVIERDASSGYDWVIMHLQAPHKITASGSVPKPGFASIAAQLTIAKGVAYLKQKNIPAAIEVFKGLEKQDSELVDHAATNLSFLYFLEGDYKNAEKYADIAVRADRYNAKALVNKANILFVNGLLEQAKELYLEAIGVEADCLEAIYNLGIVNKRMGALEDALQAFKKLHRILPKENQVIYHIGNLYDLQDDPVQASEWFSILHAGVPTDPKILARLGALASKQKDDNQAFPHYIESYNCFPASMDVITWLGVWFVRNEHYEKAIQFFLRAAEVEPEEMKWQLMVASCYRRMGSFSQALQLYKDIHKQDPDNLECLRYLCSLCKESNDQEYEQYAKLLRKAEKQQQAASGPAVTSAAPAPSSSPGPRASPSVGGDMRLNSAEAEPTPMGGMGMEDRPAVELNETLTKPLEPKAVRTFQPREKNEDEDPWDDGDDILPDA